MIDFSQYAADTQKLKTILSVQALTKIERFDILFASTFPMIEDYDEDNDKLYITDFPEVAPMSDSISQTAVRSIMFTGVTGSGKRTAEKYYGKKLYDYISEQADDMSEEETVEDSLLYYRIQSFDLTLGSKSSRCDKIADLFQQIINIAKENRNKIMYVAFGDITDILKCKKSAKCFVNYMELLYNIPEIICVTTCIYNGKASELSENLKDPFIVEELTLPDDAWRSEFFSDFRKNHPNILIEVDSSVVLKLTKNFTVRMLVRLAERMVIKAKGKLIHDDGYSQEDYTEFVTTIFSEEWKKVKISSVDFKKITDDIRNIYYVPEQKNVLSMPFTMPVANDVQKHSESKSKEKDSKENKDEIQVPNTTAEVKKEVFALRVPILKSSSNSNDK